MNEAAVTISLAVISSILILMDLFLLTFKQNRKELTTLLIVVFLVLALICNSYSLIKETYEAIVRFIHLASSSNLDSDPNVVLNYLFFTIPFHLFSLVEYIVLIQWYPSSIKSCRLQLWAVLE